MANDQAASSYTLKVEGGEAIELKEGDLDSVVFRSDSPDDADAKSNKMAYVLEMMGKVIQGKNEKETIKLAKWAVLPAGSKDVERKVTVELVKTNKVVRQFVFSSAFVVDYVEDIGEEGIGTFKLFLKQNRSIKDAKITIEGGYDK